MTKNTTMSKGKTMIKKETKLVITFFTTTEAMHMEQTCKVNCADGRLIPVPRAITAGCGLAWCASPDSRDALLQMMKEHQIRYQAIYDCEV